MPTPHPFLSRRDAAGLVARRRSAGAFRGRGLCRRPENRRPSPKRDVRPGGAGPAGCDTRAGSKLLVDAWVCRCESCTHMYIYIYTYIYIYFSEIYMFVQINRCIYVCSSQF